MNSWQDTRIRRSRRSRTAFKYITPYLLLFFSAVLIATALIATALTTSALTAAPRGDYYNKWKNVYEPQQRYSEAINVYKQAIREYPREPWFHVYVGVSYHRLRRYDRGLPYFIKAAQLARNDSGIKRNLRYGALTGFNGFLRNRNCRAGLQSIGPVLQLLPGDSEIITKSLAIYMKCKEFSRAEKLADSLSGTKRLIMLGQIRLQLNRDSDALKYFNRAILLKPESYRVEESISRAYRTRVQDLPYRQQMSSPYQNFVVAHAHAAVRKYFRAHPYRQNVQYIPPLKGKFCIGQGAGGRSFHYGLKAHYSFDLALCRGRNATGTPIFAVADGVVVTAVYKHPDRRLGLPVDLNARANYVRIEHAGGIFSMYVHNKQWSGRLKKGDRVKAGAIIALTGNSGVSTGPHVHFSMSYKDGITIPAELSGLFAARSPGNRFSPIKLFDMKYKWYQTRAVAPQVLLRFPAIKGKWLMKTAGRSVWEFLTNGRAKITPQSDGRPLVLHARYRMAGRELIVTMRKIYRFRLEADKLISRDVTLYRMAGPD